MEGSHGFKLVKNYCEFKYWNKNSFGNTREKIKCLQAKISEVQQSTPTRENLEQEASLSLELDGGLAKEDMKWKKKSRELWVKEGNRNTRFFHLSTIIRRHWNCISDIKLNDGSWINSREEIQNYFIDNFKALYQTSFPPIPNDLSNLIETCVFDQENESLCRIPSREEIKKVVFSMKSLKTSSLDDFPALFYKHY